MIEEVVPDALAGERLDRFVSLAADCSRSVASNLIDTDNVTVDGRVARSGKVRLETGQAVAIAFVPEDLVELPEPDADVPIEIVYADDDLLVVDKLDGQIVHPGAGNPSGTMVNGLLARFPEIATVGDPMRPGIVHRLDKGTTGLLIVARSQPAYDGLVEALSERLVTREYLALCWGTVENERGVVDAAISRSGKQRTRMAVNAEGKPARTHYEVLARREHDPLVTLVRCRLETGRTHQIRVHMSAIGHAVVGDGTYRGDRASLPFDRPALHAEHLEFVHPVSGKDMEFTSPRPGDMAALIRQVLPGH